MCTHHSDAPHALRGSLGTTIGCGGADVACNFDGAMVHLDADAVGSSAPRRLDGTA